MIDWYIYIYTHTYIYIQQDFLTSLFPKDFLTFVHVSWAIMEF